MGAGGNDTWALSCAGPVRADLPANRAIRLPLAAILHRSVKTTVARSRRFSGGGWSGTVTERLSTSAGPADPRARGHGQRRPPPPRRRELDATFRVSALTGSAAMSWVHPPARCQSQDACGRQGSARIRPVQPRATTLTLSAYGPLRRPRIDFLTALGVARGGDSHGLPVLGFSADRTRVQTTMTSRQAGHRCRAAGAGSLRLGVVGSAGGLRIGEYAGFAGPDPVRTACPGAPLAVHALGSTRLNRPDWSPAAPRCACPRPAASRPRGARLRSTRACASR